MKLTLDQAEQYIEALEEELMLAKLASQMKTDLIAELEKELKMVRK